MDNNFTNIVLTSSKIEVIKAINNVLRIDDKVISISKTNDKQDTLDNSKQLIVGISACATGIAHTYMAREALEKHGKEMGYDVWIETQGQSGQEHKLSSELINKASYVVIASDIGLDLERFKGKKIYITKTNEAINTPKQTLNKAINSANIYGANTNNENNVFESSHSKGFMKHFLAGVSYMIPFIVFSGIVYAILNAICVGLHDTGKNPDGSLTIMGYALQVANVGFALFTGVMGAFIAQSIGGRAALGPGFIASFVASSPSMYLFYGMTKEA
jgi:PTS system fructose-specific IIC component